MDSGSKLHAVPWMIRVLGSRLWMVAALAGLEMVIAGGGVYTAWVMRDLVNAAVGGASDALRLSVVVFAAVSAALIALQALYRFLQKRARTMFQNILRLRFLGKVLHAELSSVQAVHTGEWMSRLTDDARIVASGVTTVVPSPAGMLAQLVGSLALLVHHGSPNRLDAHPRGNRVHWVHVGLSSRAQTPSQAHPRNRWMRTFPSYRVP